MMTGVTINHDDVFDCHSERSEESLRLNVKVLLISIIKVTCSAVNRLRAEEVREFEGYGLVISAALCSLQLETELVELDRKELDRHVAVECLCICPALHAVLVRHLLVHAEECVKLVIIDMAVLERHSIYDIMNT